jgi:hypothetical protein
MTTDEPTLDDVARWFPGWHCERGVDRLYHARLRDRDPEVSVRGEDPLDLMDEIRRRITQIEEGRYRPEGARL